MDKLQFKISSALKDLIGRDLIINDNVAIFELIKNSYDAYAENVEIVFEENKIIISDNGKGMSYDDLINKWLFLAYSEKKDSVENRAEDRKHSYRDNINRHFAGAKGVGRFSCDRLGEKLVLTTCSKKNNTVERISVNWADFEKDQKEEFVNIRVNHETLKNNITFPENQHTGTILEITNLRNKWDRTKLLILKNSLEKLINPFSETTHFSIEIICNREKSTDLDLMEKNIHDRNIVNGIIKNTITKIITLKTTKIEVKVNKDYIETSLIDRDIEIYKIREKNIFSKLNNVEINLYFLNTAAKRTFTIEMGLQPVKYGSVFLFRNGFRILPFGDENDDSWGINRRTQQGYNRTLGTRDLFGRVDIHTDRIDEFKEVSSRDGGLIQSETTIQLFRLFEITHRRLERYVTGVLWGEGFLKREYFKEKLEVEKNREALRKDKDLDSPDYIMTSCLGSKVDFIQLIKTLICDKNIEVLSYNQKLADVFSEPTFIKTTNPQIILDLKKIAQKTGDIELLDLIQKTQNNIIQMQNEKLKAEKRADEAIIQLQQANKKTEQAQYEAQIAIQKQKETELYNKRLENENLFLQTDVNSDVQQLTSLQHTITHTSNTIEVKLKKAMDCVQQKDLENLFNILNEIFILNQRIQTVSGLVSKVNFDTKASKIKKDFIKFVNDYVSIYCTTNYSMVKFHVEKTNIVWNTRFEPIKIIIIIDNLISNSLKADAQNISINWSETDNEILLNFMDDGIGIKEKNIPFIFNYRFTTTDGGGLGLFHVKNIMEQDFCGNIEFVRQHISGAVFKIIFPRERK